MPKRWKLLARLLFDTSLDVIYDAVVVFKKEMEACQTWATWMGIFIIWCILTTSGVFSRDVHFFPRKKCSRRKSLTALYLIIQHKRSHILFLFRILHAQKIPLPILL